MHDGLHPVGGDLGIAAAAGAHLTRRIEPTTIVLSDIRGASSGPYSDAMSGFEAARV